MVNKLRKFYWFITTSEHKYGRFQRTKRYHLYVSARPRFSVNEMYAKQFKVFEKIEKLPINEEYLLSISVQSDECPDGKLRLVMPSCTTISQIDLKVDRIKRTMKFYYDNYLEFVSKKKKHLKIFLDWIIPQWGGHWIVGNTDKQSYHIAEIKIPKKKE